MKMLRKVLFFLLYIPLGITLIITVWLKWFCEKYDNFLSEYESWTFDHERWLIDHKKK